MSAETSTQPILNDNSSTTNPLNDSNDSKDANKEVSTMQNPLNILSRHHDIKIDEQFILRFPKISKNVTMEVKNSCKILHFSSDWSFEDILGTIDGLEPKDYPQLFIFVIDAANLAVPVKIQQEPSNNCAKLQDKLMKFAGTRPIILQLSSVDESGVNIYYKKEDSFQFIAIDQSENIDPFPSFLNSLCGGQYEDSELKVLNAVKELSSCSLLLRFLHTLELSDGFFGSLVLHLAERGSKSEFIAALDAPFTNDGRFLSNRAQRHISLVFRDDDDPEDDDESVLLTAIQHQNSEIIDYLITYWSHLIQELPFEHQVRISTAALETNQLDVLCDLLEIADFPFPKDFKVDDIEHPRLSLIITERTALMAAIQADNFDKIDEYASNHSSHKFIYSLSNSSALAEAISLKKFAVFYYLKSLGMKGEDCDERLRELSKEDRQQAIKLATEQRQQNVQKSQFIAPKPVMLMFTKSSIHNNRTSKPQQIIYREKIIKWFKDIHTVAPELIDVVASCKDLRLIFDFESHSVENMTLTGSNALGSTYTKHKEIFMGAKLPDNDNKQRDQQIKGVLAHELCHYVMKLVYENQEHPYYKIMVKIAEMFEEIVKAIDKWSAEDSVNPDDECNGIISTVFTLYPIKDFHPELIVRVVHILAEYDDDQDKTQYLQDKYKILFDFNENQVIPDLRAFNIETRESVRKMNRLMELLKSLKSKSYAFKNPKDIKELLDPDLTIVTSNVPTLLLKEIHNYLQNTAGDIFDTQNVFVNPKALKNEEILEDFKKLLRENSKLNVIVDCSEYTEGIGGFRGSRTIFVVSNEALGKDFVKAIDDLKESSIKVDRNYNWNDLTEESQEQLINHEIEFQNWTGLTLLELLMSEKPFKEPESSEAYQIAKSQVLSDFSKVVDDELLNLLVNGTNICINVSPEDEDDRNFIERLFIKKIQGINESELLKLTSGIISRHDQVVEVENITKEVLLDVQGKPVVLISDIAGSGKSWAMKNFAEILSDDDSIKWVTFVDLKQFIDEFKAHDGKPDFAAFVAEKILKPRHKFVAKIFQKLYKIGKVLIFFDGFDEIAPNCAEFVSELAQDFQQNGGNQLWIATRDYFEVDLQKTLKTDAVYGLVDLTFDDAVELIAQKWMGDDNKWISGDESESDSNEEYEIYRQKAQKIVAKFHFNWLNSVGMPLQMKMIAEASATTKDCMDIDVTIIFKKYIQKLIKIWSHEKGKIREEASIECQELEYSLMQIHHYWAIASLFPESLKILFPDYDPSEWPDLEIAACGLMKKIGEKVFFVYETYREYFAADYLAKALKKAKISDAVLEIFNEILENKKFDVIRKFLNGLVDGLQNLKKVKNFDEILDGKS